MKTIWASLFVLFATLGAGNLAHSATLVLGGYPNSLLVVDENTGSTQKIVLETGLPMGIRPSNDKKRIYVTTIDHAGIEVYDVASRKIINHFTLNTPTERYRFNSGTPDPAGRLFYAIVTKIEKRIDRFEIGKAKFAVIDLDQKKIIGIYNIPKEDEAAFRGFGRGVPEISQDGRFLYQFGEKVIIIDTATFKVVDRIAFSKTDIPGFTDISLQGGLRTFSQPNQYVSLFSASDPYVHNNIVGIANFDLTERRYVFAPIGPAPTTMLDLHVSPNRRDAYAVVTNSVPSASRYGVIANGLGGAGKRCEFWRFNLQSNAIDTRAEFPCRTRFNFGISGDGSKLYIYGAGHEIEIYDASTLRYESTWDLENDITIMTPAGMVVVD